MNSSILSITWRFKMVAPYIYAGVGTDERNKVIIYFLICAVSILAGRGILHLLGVKVDPSCSIFLAPLITLTLWAILLGLSVSSGFTVRDVRLYFWILTILLAVVGLWRGRYRFIRQDWPIILVVILAPVVLMAPYFWNGITSYLGSPAWDGWSYIAYGQYLLDYPRGTEGGLSPLDQYAAHLNGTRFIASALLGFLALISGSNADTQMASGLFLAWSLFVFSSSCMLVGKVSGIKRLLTAFYVGICVFSGWLLSLLSMNNYDNALAISFLPAFAGVSHIVKPQYKRWAFILAGMIIAIIYCYPEMSPFVLGGACLFFIQRIVRDAKPIKPWIILSFMTCVLMGIGIAPLYDLVLFFIAQLQAGLGNGVRPGEGALPGLLKKSTLLMCFWGFHSAGSSLAPIINVLWFFLCSLLSLVLSIMAVLGICDLFKRREWGFAATLIVLFAGSLYMIVVQKYSYGAYKLILLNWWAMVFAVILGVDKLLALSGRRGNFRVAVKCSFVGLFVFFSCLNAAMAIQNDKALNSRSVLPFKKVTEIKDIVGPRPVIVAVNDPIANEWAVYFLRNMPISLTQYRAYMAQAHVIPLMQRAREIDITKVKYAVTDSKGSFPKSDLLWKGGPYYLWKLKDNRWLQPTEIRNPNGLEKLSGKPFFWIGKGDTEIDLLSTENGTAVISAEFLLGPSLPDKPDRRLVLLTDKGYQTNIIIAKNGPQEITVPVVRGKNRIILHPLDRPSVSITGNGDKRPLLIGVRGLKVRLKGSNQ